MQGYIGGDVIKDGTIEPKKLTVEYYPQSGGNIDGDVILSAAKALGFSGNLNLQLKYNPTPGEMIFDVASAPNGLNIITNVSSLGSLFKYNGVEVATMDDITELKDEVVDHIADIGGFDNFVTHLHLSENYYTKTDVDQKMADLGTVEVDLTDYYSKVETDGLLDEKQDQLSAGENVTISADNKISAKDTIYDDSDVKGAIAELQDEVNEKANASDVYTKEDVDGKIEEVVEGQEDMALYYKKTETDSLLNEKQAKLIVGPNIQIDENNTISAVDTIYDDSNVRVVIAGLEEEINKKADATTVYTKEETDERLEGLGGNNSDNVFVVNKTTYNSTTFTDLMAAIELNKAIVFVTDEEGLTYLGSVLASLKQDDDNILIFILYDIGIRIYQCTTDSITLVEQGELISAERLNSFLSGQISTGTNGFNFIVDTPTLIRSSSAPRTGMVECEFIAGFAATVSPVLDNLTSNAVFASISVDFRVNGSSQVVKGLQIPRMGTTEIDVDTKIVKVYLNLTIGDTVSVYITAKQEGVSIPPNVQSVLITR